LTLTEIDIQLTTWEKFQDFLDTSEFSIILLAPIILITLVLLPILMIVGLTWENIIERTWYKLTGKHPRPKPENFKNPFSGLPIDIDFQMVWLIDGEIEKMKREFTMKDDDFNDIQIGKLNSDPVISELSDKYFECKSFAFDNNVFVHELLLPEFNSRIGYIDTKNLSYENIVDVKGYPSITYSDKSDVLELVLRKPKMKKLIRIEK